MNVRRALTATAATALLAPAALLTAASAQATGPAPAPTASAPPTSSGTPSATPTTAPTGTPSATPAAPPGAPGATPTRPLGSGPTHDPCRRTATETAAVTTKLSTPPGDVVAGSDWVGLSYVTRNISDVVMDRVDNYLSVTAAGKAARSAAPHLTLQWLDSGGWATVDPASGYVTAYADLMIGETLAKPMRMKADAGTPPGTYTFTLKAGYRDESGLCGFSEPVTYRFEVLPAQGGEDGPGEPGDGHATPTPAPSTPHPTPTPTHHPATGSLAATGTPSALPVLALGSGLAVLAGVGVVFAVRRRTDGGDA